MTKIKQMERTDQWLPGAKERVRRERNRCVVIKGDIRDPCTDGNVLYLNCIIPGILVVILYYSFSRCYHWGKLERAADLFVLFLSIICESVIAISFNYM